MDWENVKEAAQRWYSRAAQFFLFQNIMVYLWACISSHHAVGLTGYIGFLYHACMWRGW
jgi:hypothetical protein